MTFTANALKKLSSKHQIKLDLITVVARNFPMKVKSPGNRDDCLNIWLWCLKEADGERDLLYDLDQ